MDAFYRDHLLAGDVGSDESYRQFLFFSTDQSVLARLADFPASLAAASPLPNIEPMINVLQAMQQLAIVRTRSMVN